MEGVLVKECLDGLGINLAVGTENGEAEMIIVLARVLAGSRDFTSKWLIRDYEMFVNGDSKLRGKSVQEIALGRVIVTSHDVIFGGYRAFPIVRWHFVCCKRFSP